MATKASPIGKNVEGQEPSPPVDRPELVTTDSTPKAIQRQTSESSQKNTLKTTPRIFVEWVMEDEVEDPGSDEFLKWPTRLAFIHDRVQLRVQIEGLVLADGAEFSLSLGRINAALPDAPVMIPDAIAPSDPEDDPLLLISTDQAEVDAFKGPTAVKVNATQQNDVGGLKTNETDGVIYWEPAEGDGRSFVVTTVRLPDVANIGLIALNYSMRFSVKQDGAVYRADAPPIRAVRWWTNPHSNLGMPRRKADSIEHLVDLDYFQACFDAIEGTVKGDEILVASWSFNPFTLITGGEGAAEAAAKAGSLSAVTDQMILRRLGEAAKREVDVYILLDAVNGPVFEKWVNALLAQLGLSAAELARIHLRQSPHPKMQKIGIGPFSREKQFSSYHEKYVVVSGSADVALVGGIDFQPDRHSPVKHKWKHWKLFYYIIVCNVFGWDYTKVTDRYQQATLQMLGFGGPSLEENYYQLWHDAGVRVEGKSSISGIRADFARRWNEGTGGGVTMAQPTVDAEADEEWNCQLCLTDHLKDGSALKTSSGNHFGSWDAHRAAILGARQYIYIENQYCRHPEMRDLLVKVIKRNPKLQVMIVVPFRTEETAMVGAKRFDDQTLWAFVGGINEQEMMHRGYLHGDYLQYEFLTQVRAADPTRVVIATLAGVAKDYDAGAKAHVDNVQQIYPHSKTMVVDDTWAYIGSANANGRSFKLDGEIGYVLHDRAAVTKYRKALFQEHFGVDIETRQIRKFLTDLWKVKLVTGKTKISDCSAAELATSSVVELTSPPKGQKYNGPGSWFIGIDDYV